MDRGSGLVLARARLSPWLGRNQLGARVATAAIAAPIVLAAALTGGGWLAAVIIVVAGLAGWELASLSGVKSGPTRFAAWASVGALGAGAALGTGWWLRESPGGLGWVLVVIIGTWACDTAAYAVGRRWGKRKLAPRISPQKTVEGAAAGMAAAFAVGVAAAVLGATTDPQRAVGLSGVVGVGAVLGDLLESAFKRRLGVKDSGWIMPGHGGILDRIDGLLVATPLGAAYVWLTG